MSTFQYNHTAYPFCYQGQWLDSLLELRFILSIEDTHEWTREGLKIYYNIDQVPEGITGGLASYTPDFLIKDKQKSTITLVEIKPKGFNDKWDCLRRKKIAESFISWMGYDWEFKIIWGDEIQLSKSAQLKYRHLIQKTLRSIEKKSL